MKPISTIAKRLFVAGSLLLVTACGTNGVTDPTAAPKKSGYLTVSAEAAAAPAAVSASISGYNVPATITTTSTTTSTKSPIRTNAVSGYNVPAN